MEQFSPKFFAITRRQLRDRKITFSAGGFHSAMELLICQAQMANAVAKRKYILALKWSRIFDIITY